MANPVGIPIHIAVDVNGTTLVNVARMIVIITVRRAKIKIFLGAKDIPQELSKLQGSLTTPPGSTQYA